MHFLKNISLFSGRASEKMHIKRKIWLNLYAFLINKLDFAVGIQ